MMMFTRLLRFPLLLLVFLWTAGLAQAMESTRIFLNELSNPPSAAPEPGPARLAPGPDEWMVTGFFETPDFAIPTIHHLTLLDAQGRQYPLLIERASLQYQADQIRGLRLAWRLPSNFPAETELRLVWSARGEPLAENQEIEKLLWASGRPGTWKTFSWSPARLGAPAPALMMISVQPDAAWHRWWYLLPLVVLGILGLVRRFFPAKERA